MNIYNQKGDISDDNDIYNAFNKFIFSSDRKVLHKLLYRSHIFDKVKHIPGDIVECGVFKGSGIFTWAKLIELHSHFEIKKIVGFDFFDKNFVEDLGDTDKTAMSQVFSRCDTMDNEISKAYIHDKLVNIGIPSHKFELVKGDVSQTTKLYKDNNPGFRISLLYLDLDLEIPTYDTLENFWDIVLPGGIVVFDEYGYNTWTESNAVDKFVKKHNLVLHSTNISAPTVYIIKP